MGEYGMLKLLELGCRLDAGLVREQSPVILICVEGLGVAARTVQSDDEPSTEPIAQRLFGYEQTEFTDYKSMVAGREVRIDPVFGSGPAQLLQPLCFRNGKRPGRQFAEGATA